MMGLKDGLPMPRICGYTVSFSKDSACHGHVYLCGVREKKKDIFPVSPKVVEKIKPENIYTLCHLGIVMHHNNVYGHLVILLPKYIVGI